MGKDDAFIARILCMSDADILAGATEADIERLRRSHERTFCRALAANLRREAQVHRIKATALRGAARLNRPDPA